MKNLKFKLIIILMVISLGLNVIYVHKNYRFTDTLFQEYKEQILIADEALRISVQSEDIVAKQQHYLATHRSLARARILSETIGNHNDRYRFDVKGEVYFTIPYEMDWVLEYATYSENKEEDLKKVSDIFSIYAKHIQAASSLKNLSVTHETLRNIHQEIISEQLLPETIPMPTSYYKY